ncbi:PDZ domain [Phytophthora cinnamomi]|uniref:PDZ domain n=1 Tax=Phytophthora cinnamomi TaxID=4785 RepID=UPI00355A8F39|nr:PDZ domain [Phytophthora cinnamomi]
MSLKRPQHSLDDLASPPRGSRTKSGKSRRSRRTLHSSESTCSSSSSGSSDAALPLASAPRTVEIMWGGRAAPGFTLKRKRTGAILVSTVTRETQAATTLRVGSELKLVGGFPVNRLTLQDVKKVMLMAPKPVSLVFVNADDVVVASVDDASARLSTASSAADRSLASTTLSTASLRRSVSMDMNALKQDSGEESDSSDVSTASAPAFYSTPSESNRSKKRKVSTLQVALDRVNQLLNRPVRQAGLHIAAGKSIVV